VESSVGHYLERLRHHVLKEIPSGPGVKAFFCFRPSTTIDAFHLVVFKGVIYLSSAGHGALTLMPFEPDALVWLDDNAHTTDVLLEAVPQNMLELIIGCCEDDDGSLEEVYHDSIDFFFAALQRFVQLRRKAA
jgi:hypothetical protein